MEETGEVEKLRAEKLKSLGEEMVAKGGEFLRSELALTLDDYRLLEKMNLVTAEKFSKMSLTGDSVATTQEQLRKQYAQLEPYLAAVDTLDEKVTRLEEMAYAVDAYTKRLEARFKQLEKGPQSKSGTPK